MRKQQHIAGLLLDRLDPSMTPGERRATWEQIRTELTSGWQTEEHPRERLTVADEREHVLFFLAEVMYQIVPGFYEELAEAMTATFGAEEQASELPRLLRFGSWVGGDMDGAPDVHAKTIRETLQRQHLVIVNAYFLEVQRLGERLSQSASRVGVSKALQSRIDEYSALMPAANASAPARHDRMPYRQFCALLATRLRNTYDGRPHRYENPVQFASDVRLMAASLAAHQGARAGHFHVVRLLRRIDTFGFHLATLDVRQQAEVHRIVVGQGFGDPDFASRPAVERLERIRRALEHDEGPSQTLDALGRRTLAVFEQLAHSRHRHGRDAIGEYVVSGAAGADDVLAVLLLARWGEFVDKRVGEVPLDVAPLLDSVDALRQCGAIARALLAEPIYRRHVRARGDRQAVMLGYGDSNKESGFATSRWLLHQAQSELADVSHETGVALTTFHGRGGTTSRGTNRIATLVRSAPPGSFAGVLRVTEQGEAINQNYALRQIASRSLEQALGAASQTLAAGPRGAALDPACAAAFDTIATESMAAYRGFVYDGGEFYRYFREVTPIDVIERMQIGSRPAMRAGRSGVDAMRSVPWGFAWSQSRHLIPAWFGFGAGLEAAEARHGAGVLEHMAAHWAFFGSVVDEVEFGLAIADMTIASWYAQLASAERRVLFAGVQAEYERTQAWILRLRGERRLLDSDPGIQRAMKLRNPYVDPMHLMQIDLLRRWRATDRQDFDLQEALVASIGGIAQGLQATG